MAGVSQDATIVVVGPLSVLFWHGPDLADAPKEKFEKLGLLLEIEHL